MNFLRSMSTSQRVFAGITGVAVLGVGESWMSENRKRKLAKCDNPFPFKLARQNTSAKTLPIACRDGTLIFPWSAPSREKQVASLQDDVFDVLVIGGGCVGAGVALDASTRGLKVALVERDDFAAGTSGRSTKLIHGGVRYLENAFKHLDYSQYLLVKEALEERSHMLRAAPYCGRPIPIMVPLEQSWKIPYFWIGTKVYDLVAGRDSGVPASMFLSKAQSLYNFPMLNKDKISGAIVYYDGQMNDTRYTLLVLLTAVQAGAAVANHTNVEQLLKNEHGDIIGARVKDTYSGKEYTIKAKSVVNATGPFSDKIRHMAEAEDGKPVQKKEKTKKVVPRTENAGEESKEEEDEEEDNDVIVPAGGIHLVLPDHFSPNAMGLIVPETDDGRVLFFLPWEGGTLCGTTDSETKITDLPKPSSDDVDIVLRESGRYLNRRISRSDVRAAWSGIRPLVRDMHGHDTKAISREHIVEVNPGNMVSILGGKFTTYRKMSEDGVDKLLSIHPALQARAGPCHTTNLKLIGADRAGIVCEQKFNVITVTLREDYGYDRDIAEHLTRNYGTRALQIAEIVKHGYPTRAKGLHPKRLVAKHPFLEAEVIFAVRHEYALSAVDVIARRTRLAFVDHDAAVECLPQIIDLMAKLLNWGRSKKNEETKKALEFLDTMKCPDRT